jgi:ATP-dependent helicase HepA
MIGFLAGQTAMIGNPERFEAISQCLKRDGLFEDRATALIAAIDPLIRAQAKCVIFCSDAKTADALAKRIADDLGIIVDRHNPEDDAWIAFESVADHAVLVCDRRGEEGLNLQGGKKVVVHYDLPFNPNRIEQRLGRADRYGSGDAVRSLVLACEDDALEMAWIDYLDTALRVFERSVASLQYLIEQTVRGRARLLFTDGAETLNELTEKSAGEQGLIEREIKAIDQQDALDSLGTPSTDLVDQLSDVDEDWQSLADDMAIWIEQTLQFGRFDESQGIGPSAPFRYVYSTTNRHTLVPLSTFMAHCADALDLSIGSRFGRSIRTIPYTFRRRTALNRNARANGVGLLRYGDAFVSGMTTLTEADDRGRSFAMWRFAPDHSGDPLADIYFRFDFVLEADVTAASDVLSAHKRDSSAARAAVRRRGDMALAPFFRSIWLDRELMLVDDEALLGRLGRAYSVQPDRDGAVDLNLNARRWQRLLRLELPELAYWAELCSKAREAAEAALRADHEVLASLGKAEQHSARVDHGRLGQLRARAQSNPAAEQDGELVFEERLASALRAGIRVPRVRLDTIGAVFMSASRSATDRISGGI